MRQLGQLLAGGADPAGQIGMVSIRLHLMFAMMLGIILVGGVGGWASATMISGAVIAPGRLVVESDVKKVQHPTGGIVGQLLVNDGDRVREGEVVIRLDQTQTRATLEIVLRALDELMARRARDEAERDGAAVVVFPAELATRRDEPSVARLLDGEQRLFVSRKAGRDGQTAQLHERINQLQQEVGGLLEQINAKANEIALIGSELQGVRQLYARKLIQLSRVTALEREAARLAGERGQLIATIASTKGKISETTLEVLQIDKDMRTEVSRDLADIRGKWSELAEKRIAAEDQLKRLEMRAPQAGFVHQLAIHTVGGLVVPSEPAMLIVPGEDRLLVQVRVRPQDINNVRIGQKAMLRFSAFDMRTTPELEGHVVRLSPDVTQDPKTGTSSYMARIAINAGETRRLHGLKLVPGMPVESYMATGGRTVLSYLTKPIMDHVAKAWRE